MERSSLELKKYVVPEIITGLGARRLVSRYVSHFSAHRPMIVTDNYIARLPWFNEIAQSLAAAGYPYILFDQVSPNPRDFEAMAGADLLIKNHCDLLIAVGGGSVMDCAKCISIVSANGGHILDYVGVDEIDLPGPPLICIPTTAGTSADVSQFAIILDTGNRVKKAIISKKAVPDLALIDPLPLMDMDPYLTACTAMDALTHAIEAYVSNANSALTDVHALEAVRLISGHIHGAVSGTRSLETMNQLMLGSLQAGMAFSNASLGAVHALAHSLGGLLDLPHGECNSILLGPVVEYNFDADPSRYRIIAEHMDIRTQPLKDSEVKMRLLDKIRSIRESIGIPSVFQITFRENQLEQLVDHALKDPCMVTNPKSLTKHEVRNIFESVIRYRTA